MYLNGTPLAYSVTAEWLLLRKKEKPLAEISTSITPAPRLQHRAQPVTFVFNGGLAPHRPISTWGRWGRSG